MSNTLTIRYRASGATGAPSSLKSGELAWNMVSGDGYIYAGFGDDGSGNATSIKAIAKDDFSILHRLPGGGTSGQVLIKDTGTDFDVSWQDAPVVLSEGTGIDITDDTISVDASVIAFLASPAFTGNPTAPTQSAGNNSTRLATTAFVQGELTTGLATKAAASHTHSASDITSGTIDVARLPVLPGQNQVVASSNIASLDSGQQATIALGTIVTTSDGRRWVYNTGTKTSEASYVELADVTPEWAVIANKPSFATVATTGAYSDLSGKPSLGTIASQNSNSVTITGGSISGIVLSGGTF